MAKGFFHRGIDTMTHGLETYGKLRGAVAAGQEMWAAGRTLYGMVSAASAVAAPVLAGAAMVA